MRRQVALGLAKSGNPFAVAALVECLSAARGKGRSEVVEIDNALLKILAMQITTTSVDALKKIASFPDVETEVWAGTGEKRIENWDNATVVLDETVRSTAMVSHEKVRQLASKELERRGVSS